MDLVGRQVGDFRLLEVLGEGGMGTAYLAEQVTLRREAVVKTMRSRTALDGDGQRFLREARLASRLDHPYAAHVYAFGIDDGVPWIAMELVRGVRLDDFIQDQGALPLARFLPLFDRLCEVIYSAHAQGIIHRDIKPANIMVVRRAGRLLPKLLDFGIASDRQLTRDPGDNGEDETVTGRDGSPRYMAPERWTDADRVSPQSDLYALAITAYEMLTARELFTGASPLLVARAHARAAIPPVGPNLPSALDHVFARALSRAPEHRYRDALELGAAIREVAHQAATELTTSVDETVRDTFIAGGPQPLAETLLELSAARGPGHAWGAAWRTVDVLVRIVGVVALGSRVGVGEKLDSATTQRVRQLVERGLDTDEWLDLIASSISPFAANPPAHPIPELVIAFADAGEARRHLEDLGRLRGVDVEARRLPAVIQELAKVLRACSFLADYTWVDGRGQVWMGPRHDPRERRAMQAGVAADSMWMLDRDGAPVLRLSPLAHVASPSPGADEELFLIDGPAKRGARAVAWPREFVRHDEQLWRYVAGHLAPLDRERADKDAEDAVPYRGLASFGPSDAAMFFGREREVEAVVNRLRVDPFLAVVGPSGVGKSSFVHAGVLPALPETWQTVTFRPGPAPFSALEAKLVARGLAPAGIGDRVRGDPEALRDVLDDAGQRQGSTIVIVIDQLEELFTQCRDIDTRDQLSRALAAIADPRSAVRAIVTLRDDFLVRTAELPALGPRLNTSLELVTLPDPIALKRILGEPLKQVGYVFESEKMPDEMIAEVRQHPSALALLSFAASKLWELRDRGFRHIPRRAYTAIGGVVGALAKHADETLDSLSESHQKLVRELFRNLVTSEGTRATLSRAEALQLLGATSDAERVIETLVERRLIVAYEGEAKAERIEVIHEALLTAWPRLVGWQREDAAGSRMRDQVRSAARQWGERERPKGLLWRGEALLELKLWRSRYGMAVTDLEQAFISASIADETRSRRLRRTALATVVVGLIAGLIVLQRANGVARRNAAASERARVAMLVEQGRTALIGGRPQEALIYLSDAQVGGADDPNIAFMLGSAHRALAGELLVLRTETLGVGFAAMTPDGARIVSSEGEGPVRVWDARTGALERSIAGPVSVWASDVPQLVGARAALTHGPDAVPTVWDLTTGQSRFALAVKPGTTAEVSADGETIATLDRGELETWSAVDGSSRGRQAIAMVGPAPPVLRIAGDRYVALADDRLFVGPLDLSAPPVELAKLKVPPGMHGTGLAVDRRGRYLAAIDASDVLVWDLAARGEPKRLAGHGADVWAVAFSPDSARVATASGDHTARIWDLAGRGRVVSLDGHDGYISAIAWSPDGGRVATASADHTVRLWDAETGAPLAVFYAHTDAVNDVEFGPTGDRVISASNDGTVRVFDARRTNESIDLDHRGPLTLASHDAQHVLIVGHDSRAWLYDVGSRAVVAFGPYEAPTVLPRIDAQGLQSYGDIDRTAERIVIPANESAIVIRLADREHPLRLAHSARVICARFGPDGRIVTGMLDGQLVVWSADGKEQRRIAHGTMQIADIAFDRDTSRFAVASGDGVKIYDLADPSYVQAMPKLASDVGLAFSRDGSWLASAGDDTIVRIADISSGNIRFGTQGASTMSGIAISPDDRRVFVANQEGSVAVYDTTHGRLLERVGDARENGWMTGIVALDDRIITADDVGRVRVWPMSVEKRPPDVVAAEVKCTIPLELVDTRIIPRAIPASCK